MATQDSFNPNAWLKDEISSGQFNPDKWRASRSIANAVTNPQSPKDDVMGLLYEQGLSPSVIAGLMANIGVETGDSYDYQQQQYEGGPGRGLFQMEGKMLEAYRKYLASLNKADSAQSQIDFVQSALGGDTVYDIGAGHRNKLKKAFQGDNPAVVAEEFSNRFLRPGKPNLKERIKKAKEL